MNKFFKWLLVIAVLFSVYNLFVFNPLKKSKCLVISIEVDKVIECNELDPENTIGNSELNCTDLIEQEVSGICVCSDGDGICQVICRDKHIPRVYVSIENRVVNAVNTNCDDSDCVDEINSKFKKNNEYICFYDPLNLNFVTFQKLDKNNWIYYLTFALTIIMVIGDKIYSCKKNYES